MIFAIVKNEFLQSFRGHKLTIAMLVCCTLLPLSTFMMLLDYDQRYANYAECQSREVLGRFEFENCCGYGNKFTYPDNAGIGKPGRLSIVSKGVGDALSGTLELESNWLEPIFGIKEERNIFAFLFGSFDLLLVSKVAIGLLAIVFGCGTVVSERETGTLALTFSNRIARAQFIIGKFGGGVSILLASYIAGLILCLVLLTSWPRWSFTKADYAPVALIFVALVVYVILSYLLGMVVSCLCRTMATASISAVVVWLVTVVLLPLLLVYFAEITYQVPSFEGTVRRKIDAARALLQEAKPYFNDDGSTKYGLPRLRGELGESLSYKEAEVMWAAEEKALRAERTQIDFARLLLTSVSSGALTNIVRDLSRTSPQYYLYLKRDALRVAEAIFKRRFPTINQWREMFRGNLDPEQFNWGRHETFSKYTNELSLDEAKIMSLLKNPVFDHDSRPLEISWLWPDYDYFAEATKYTNHRESEKMFRFVDMASLIISTFACFGIAFSLMMRYDVRPT